MILLLGCAPAIERGPNCDGLDVFVDLADGPPREDVEAEATFWNDLGFSFGPVWYWPYEDRVPETGTYIVRDEAWIIEANRERESPLAAATQVTEGPFCAVVFDGWDYSREVLRHELGHALGFPDVATRGHLMNPVHGIRGTSTEGLRP